MKFSRLDTKLDVTYWPCDDQGLMVDGDAEITASAAGVKISGPFPMLRSADDLADFKAVLDRAQLHSSSLRLTKKRSSTGDDPTCVVLHK